MKKTTSTLTDFFKNNANLSIDSLPDETLIQIISYAENPKELLSQSTVSWRWEKLIEDDQVWQKQGYANYAAYKMTLLDPKRKTVNIALLADAPNTVKSEIMKVLDIDSNDSKAATVLKKFFNLAIKKMRWGDSFWLEMLDVPSFQNEVQSPLRNCMLGAADVWLLCIQEWPKSFYLLDYVHNHGSAYKNKLIYIVTSETANIVKIGETLSTRFPNNLNREIIIYQPTAGIKHLFDTITATLVVAQTEPDEATTNRCTMR